MVNRERITGGFTAAFEKLRQEDCGHDDWGYYPALQAIFFVWCRTCGTLRRCLTSDDGMDIVENVYLMPRQATKEPDDDR